MISQIGNLLLLSQIFISVVIIISPNFKVSKTFFYIGCFCIVGSFLVLINGFIISDFSVQNIFFNSSTLKPLIFKISAAWASHEGSMLLWLSLLNFIGVIYIYISFDNSIISLQLKILSQVNLLFSSFIYFTSNPFVALSFRPIEGLGLNPALQDVALAIHPPILYLGYVSYVAIFTNAIIILLKNNANLRNELLRNSQIFSSLGLSALTLGIGLGSWWAYRELGWGGFWFFDPVENISLLPWLAGIGLHHSLLLSIREQKFINWTLSFSIISFVLTIFGTFLVRSGLLTSVHSFAASGDRATYLFAIFIIIASASIGVLIFKFRNYKDKNKLEFREKGIKISNILWTLTILVLLSSIIYPVAYLYLSKESISMDVNFFIKSFLPIIIIISFVATIFSDKQIDKRTLIIIIISLSITIVSTRMIKCNFISAMAILGSLCLILQTCHIFLVRSNFFKQKLSASLNAMIIGHLGFGLLILSITLNITLQKEFEFVGIAGENKVFNQFNVNLKNIRFSEGPNYYRQIIEFWINDSSNNKITILKPENRYYKIEKVLSQESDIYSYLTYDLYAVLNQIDENIVHAKIYYRPLISFVWLSIIVMATGFLISFVNRFKHKL